MLRTDAEFAGEYGPASPPYGAKPGTLEHWLTERYCLYARARALHFARRLDVVVCGPANASDGGRRLPGRCYASR